MKYQKEILDLLIRHPRLWFLVGILGIWFAISTARKLFDDWAGFLEALRFSHQPGWLSLLRGELGADLKAEFKLLVWLLGTVLTMLGLKLGFTKVLVMFSLVERWHLPL